MYYIVCIVGAFRLARLALEIIGRLDG